MNIRHYLEIITRQNNTGKVARNTLYLTISELVLKIVGVLWIVFLARAFTVATYGEYNFITSYIAIFSFLPDFGVGLIVIREVARDPKHASTYLGNSFILNGILAIITFCAILISGAFFGVSSTLYPLLIISAFTLVLSTLRSVAIFYFDGTERMQYSAILNTLNTILLVICAILGAVMGFGLFGIFYGMLIGTIISLGISWATVLGFVKPKFLYDRKTILFYLKQGTPLGIASLAALIYTHIDVLVLAKYLGNTAVGTYSAATPFAFAIIQLLNVPFVVAVYPALSRIEKESNLRFRNGILKSIGLILLWSVPVSILISLLSPFVISLIFGEKYKNAIPILQVLIYFVPFAALSALLYKILIILKKQHDYLIISVIGALLNILLNITLIPLYGILGAVWATILTQLVIFIVYGVDVIWRMQKK